MMRWDRVVRAAVISTALTWTTWAAITLGPTEAQAQTPAPAHADAAERLAETYKAKGLTDATVLVAKGGVPIFRASFGLANREWGIPNASDAEFGIGSITKQFTALAILQLAHDGKLSLDDPISRFVQAAPPTWREITIRHLLTHTSGIPNHTSLPEWGDQTWIYRSPENLIHFIRDRPLDFAPGVKFQYDNTGYVILGFIVQKASGQPLSDYLAAHVFTPLGMKHTGFVGEQVLPRRASGYEHEGARWIADLWMLPIRDSGAGGIYSTADDLLTWDQALYDPKRFGLTDLTPMFTDYGHGFGLSLLSGTSISTPLSVTMASLAVMSASLGHGLQAEIPPAALPVGETGCASGVGAFAGTRLQGLAAVGSSPDEETKLGGRRSAARRGRSPKPQLYNVGCKEPARRPQAGRCTAGRADERPAAPKARLAGGPVGAAERGGTEPDRGPLSERSVIDRRQVRVRFEAYLDIAPGCGSWPFRRERIARTL